MTTPSGSRTSQVALGGILTALSSLILYFASLSPSGRLGLAAVAGLCPVFAVLRGGRGSGYLVWGATSILALLLIPEKGIALSYLLLFGLYPVMKSQLECFKSRVLEWFCKIIFAVIGTAILRHLLLGLLMDTIPSWMVGHFVLVHLVGLLVFIAYDITLSRLISLMGRRTGR